MKEDPAPYWVSVACAFTGCLILLVMKNVNLSILIMLVAIWTKL